MTLQRRLDLFGVDLLAAAVDRHRAAAQHGDASVGFDQREVARNRIAHTVDGLERLGGLLLVLVIADRDVALLGNEAAHARTGLHLVALLVKDDGAVVDGHPWPTA